MKILVAEDNPVTQALIAMTLKKWGHEVVAVSDGEQAWETLGRTAISFVVTDWMMPKMNGPELCKRIREADFGRYVYVILLTAKDDKTDLVEAMEAGADDFLVKPFHKDELNVRIRAGERVVQLEKRLEDRNRRLEEAYTVMRKDLEAAARVQESLLPCKAETILGIRFEWIFKPCAFVAGDIFNFFRLDENHIGFYILDVAGHGISAALLSVTLSHVLSRNVQGECPFVKAVPGSGSCSLLSPSQVVADLNRSFLSDEDIMQYFTMVYGTADCRSGNVRMTQAGHPSPVVARKNGSIYVPGKGGFPVGMLPDAEYDEIEFRLAPGDRLVLYSDGVTECLDKRGEMFSAERLFAILRKGRGESLDTVVGRIGDSLNEWKKEEDFNDDVTLLAMEIA